MSLCTYSLAYRRLQWSILVLSVLWVRPCVADEHFNLPPGFTLSDPKWFGEDIGDECRSLRYEEHSFGYVARVLRTGESLLVEKCHGETAGVSGPAYDGYVDGWYRAMPGKSGLVPFRVEDLDYFSVPRTCGMRVAYWGYKDLPDHDTDSQYFAYIADVPTQRILKKQFMGTAWLATDFKAYLPSPHWFGDCSEVLFADDRHFKPMRLKLPEKDARNVPSDEPKGPWMRDRIGTISDDKEGADLPEDFWLSNPHIVGDMIEGEELCYTLRIGEHTLGSITSVRKAGNGLLFERCSYQEECELGDICNYALNGQECLHGSVGGWYVATQADEDIRELEGLGVFSNPAPCGSKVAYWSRRGLPEHDTDSEYFAYVTDIESGTVPRKAFVGQAWVATDFRYHIRVPRWTPGCTEVLFHDERHFQPVTVTLGGDGDAATDPVQPQE